MILRIALPLALSLAILAAMLGGAAPFGRVFLALGLPSLAAQVLTDAQWSGLALARAGRIEEAAESFSRAGPDAAFNLGNAEAQRGNYAAALEAYDIAMAYRPDSQAETNFDLVRAFYGATRLDADSIVRWGVERDGVTVEAETGRGSGRASGTGDEVTNTGATVGLPALQSHEQKSVRKVFDDAFVVASPRWLATLEDVPGAFLAERIAHERKARLATGRAQPEAEDPW